MKIKTKKKEKNKGRINVTFEWYDLISLIVLYLIFS